MVAASAEGGWAIRYMGGLEGPPKPPALGSVAAQPRRSSIYTKPAPTVVAPDFGRWLYAARGRWRRMEKAEPMMRSMVSIHHMKA
jgi:hypothetical protein